MKDYLMSLITAVCVSLILIGIELALNVDFGFVVRTLIVVPATVLIRMCTE